MSPATVMPLPPRQRLTRGLAYTAAGPVDVARGAVGLGAAAVRGGAVKLYRSYRDSRLSDRVAEAAELAAQEFDAAQEFIAGLPELLDGDATPRPGRRRWVIGGIVAVTLLGAGVAVVAVRRANGPREESPRPPSVETERKV